MIANLFITFFKIGTFTIGGGYAMLPLIEHEVVNKKKWITPNQYDDMILLCQLVPGVIAVNCAAFVAKKIAENLNLSLTKSILYSLAAITASIIPSFVIIILIATFFRQYQDNIYLIAAMKGIRPTIIALILYAVIRMFQSSINNKHNIYYIPLSLAVAITIAYLKINPIILLLIFAILVGGTLLLKNITISRQ